LFESVIAVAFQNVFCAKIHQNDIFFIFLKIIFEISITHQNDSKHKKILIFNKKN
jgi:hypothetical protein